MTALALLVAALAAYRVSRLIIDDEWPPIVWFRRRVLDRFGKDSAWFTFISCYWCVGAYVSAAVAWVAFPSQSLREWALTAAAISAFVGVLGVLLDE